MKKLSLADLESDGSRLIPRWLGDAKVTHGGVYLFQPGETAHPEPVHVHDTTEVFIFIQGCGVLPVNGFDHLVQAGDVVIIEPGEDHHTRSSVADPLVAVWYLMDR
jgi:mannose-6-phosphate isomerase-like protein (cupin superfamily)